MTIGKVTFLANNVKKIYAGSGSCQWCGTVRARTYDFRGPGALDYRLNRPTHKFCTFSCFKAYW